MCLGDQTSETIASVPTYARATECENKGHQHVSEFNSTRIETSTTENVIYRSASCCSHLSISDDCHANMESKLIQEDYTEFPARSQRLFSFNARWDIRLYRDRVATVLPQQKTGCGSDDGSGSAGYIKMDISVS
ncbi:hypothetical protein TNCV_2297431 [Trichonephila clavipes]|nr:hypothetical protein TNCV_2297431 [Trichonephila clavipes]